MARRTFTHGRCHRDPAALVRGAAEGRGGPQPGGRCEDGPPVRGPGGGGRDGAGRPAGGRGAVAGAGPGLVPAIAGTGIRQVSWREIAVHHDRIAGLLPVVPVSVIHQRLADEQGLEASVASVRRYVRAHFPGEARAAEARPPRPPVPPGAEAQVDYGYLGLWPDPQLGPAPPGVGVLDGAAVLAVPVRPPGGEHDPARVDRGARGRVRVLRRGAAEAHPGLCSAPHNPGSVPGRVMCPLW